MKFAIALIIPLLHFNVAASDFCKSVDVPDYYWREFRGDIPYDAIPGGTDKSGVTTYIGQVVLFPYGLLPASIYKGKKTVVTSADMKTHYADRNVKILCSGSPKKFKWIATTTDKIQLIKDCHLILGGVNGGSQENIGRINYNEEIILGRVIRKPLDHDGLWVPDNGKETKFTYYEVLAYDCKPLIDVRAGTA